MTDFFRLDGCGQFLLSHPCILASLLQKSTNEELLEAPLHSLWRIQDPVPFGCSMYFVEIVHIYALS